jgi:hypothetical protein
MSAQPRRSQPPSEGLSTDLRDSSPPAIREPSLLGVGEEVRPLETERRDETRRTGTIVQATDYLENKIHNLKIDLETRMDQIDDKLNNIETLIRG